MAEPKKTPQGTWRIQIEVKGQRESNTLPTRREAIVWRDRRSVELRAASLGHHGLGKTLKDAFRAYAENVAPGNRGERWEVVRLAAFEGEKHGLPITKDVAKITDDDLRAWRDRRLEKSSRGTVIRDMTLMRSVLEYAREEKWIQANPINEVKRPSAPPHRKRTIKNWEVRRELRALGYKRGPIRSVSHAVAMAFLLALCTGMRAKEVCTLRWEDVKSSHGTAHNVKAMEMGVSRDIPLTKVAKRVIERMRGWDEELVFGIGTATLDALFRKARKKAGMDGFTFHDSRHTAATRIALSGKLNVLELCKMFGWKNPAQAMTYFNPSAIDLAKKLD